MSIVDVASLELERLGGGVVRAIHIKLGPLSGVAGSALASAFELAREGSALEQTRIVIEHVPIAIYCPACLSDRPAQSVQMLCCAVCGTPAAKVVRGNELQLTALEIEDEDTQGSRQLGSPQCSEA